MTWTWPIRVASIPANHPYVRHLAAADGVDGVVRLPDPPPDVPSPLPGQWWPPAALDIGWVTNHHREFDLLHLHFGFDAATPAQLRHWAAELARHRRPLVMTVHDLTNPHFLDQSGHRANLDVLIEAADQLITLTPAAAAQIRQRWGRVPTVIPHPHVVPLQQLQAHRGDGPNRAGELVIGVHAKSLRANVDPLPLLRALDSAATDIPQIAIRVDLHSDLLQRSDEPARQLREWLGGRVDAPGWRIEVHPMFTDDELWEYLRSIDVYVLPYRFGTHSGWLEACVDVGTGVLVPDVGCYADQHGHPSFGRSGDEIDVDRLSRLLRQLSADRSAATAQAPDRVAQRGQIAAAHERIYRRALDGAG